MDTIWVLTTMLHSTYTAVLATSIAMHALGRHENCRRNTAIITALSVPVLATATVKVDGELAGVLQPLQTTSVIATALGGLYKISSWLVNINNREADQTAQRQIYCNMPKPKTEAGNTSGKHSHPTVNRMMDIVTGTVATKMYTLESKQHYTYPQKSYFMYGRPETVEKKPSPTHVVEAKPSTAALKSPPEPRKHVNTSNNVYGLNRTQPTTVSDIKHLHNIAGSQNKRVDEGTYDGFLSCGFD